MKIILTILLIFFPAIAQDAKKKDEPKKPEPTIYLVALKIPDNKPDLAVEKKLKEDFTRQKHYTLVPSSANAEMVFVVFTEYDTYGAVVPAAGSVVGTMQTYLKSATAYCLPVLCRWTARPTLRRLEKKHFGREMRRVGFMGHTSQNW